MLDNKQQNLAWGVDGCRGGWISIALGRDSFHWELSDGITDAPFVKEPQRALIDIPIGLPDTPGRRCDTVARALLGRARSSIFSVPPRDVLAFECYKDANEYSKATYGPGMSIQTWNILPKVREVDQLLRTAPRHRSLFFETHPELCFARLHGSHLQFKKSTPEGQRERIAILERIEPTIRVVVETIKNATKRKDAAIDDIVDAACLAVGGKYGKLQPVLETPESDAHNLPMEIHYFSLPAPGQPSVAQV
jgi:predicted RNase H-like nuclease